MNIGKATAKEATLEEKLKMIIESQVDGGYNKFIEFLPTPKIQSEIDYMDGFIWTGYESGANVIQILLDTEGLKAIYGEEMSGDLIPHYKWVSHEILDSWHEGGYKEAINKAFDLL